MSNLGFGTSTVPFVEAFAPGRAIERGWLALKTSPFPILLGAVILVAADFGGDTHFDVDDREQLRQLWRLMGLAVLAGGFLSLVLFVLRVFVLPGYLRTLMSATQGRRSADTLFGELFTSNDRFLPMLLWTLLHAAIRFVCVCALLLPLLPFGLLGVLADPLAIKLAFLFIALGYGLLVAIPAFLYVDLGLFFGEYRVAIDGRGPIEALKDSWQLASGHRLWLFLFRFLMWLVAALGVFAFVIGYFATRAIADGATMAAYLSYTRGDGPLETLGGASGEPAGPDGSDSAPLPATPVSALPPALHTAPMTPVPPTSPTPPSPASSPASPTPTEPPTPSEPPAPAPEIAPVLPTPPISPISTISPLSATQLTPPTPPMPPTSSAPSGEEKP